MSSEKLGVIPFIRCKNCHKPFLEGEAFNNHICSDVIISGIKYIFCTTCDKVYHPDYFPEHLCIPYKDDLIKEMDRSKLCDDKWL